MAACTVITSIWLRWRMLRKNAGVTDIMVHAFTDGRDTSPTGGADFLDKRARDNWRRAARRSRRSSVVILRWIAIVAGTARRKRGTRSFWAKAKFCDDAPAAAVRANTSTASPMNSCPPLIFSQPNEQRVRDGDVVFFFNFRADRARQLSQAFLEPDFDGFDREVQPQVHYVTLTQYDVTYPSPYVFAPETFAHILGEVVSAAGKKQLRIAETEKYPHVTYFFNGGVEQAFAGEDRKIIPSPKVATYDLQPEMSAREVTDDVLESMSRLRPDHPEFRQSGHGRPHRRGRSGNQSGRNDRRMCRRELSRPLLSLGGKMSDHGRSRKLRADAQPRWLTEYRAHDEPGALHLCRRTTPRSFGSKTESSRMLRRRFSFCSACRSRRK